jgi:hypothetical protein
MVSFHALDERIKTGIIFNGILGCMQKWKGKKYEKCKQTIY